MQNNIDANASFILGGQIKGEKQRLFMLYQEGNFIEATAETPFFQIGETKYGKPIIDRVVKPSTTVIDATKCVLISFDSTMRSNVSVGLPIDLACYQANSLRMPLQAAHRRERCLLQHDPSPVGRRPAPGVRAAA